MFVAGLVGIYHHNGTILDPLVLEYIAYRNVTEIMLNDELLQL